MGRCTPGDGLFPGKEGILGKGGVSMVISGGIPLPGFFFVSPFLGFHLLNGGRAFSFPRGIIIVSPFFFSTYQVHNAEYKNT